MKKNIKQDQLYILNNKIQPNIKLKKITSRRIYWDGKRE